MKVVLFCGGRGMRIRDYSDDVPKPMVPIGYRPILWHVMKYYAHFGHKDFILCLGHRADVIKQYFLNYEETISNDFILSKGGREVALMNSDIADWRITFADTGIHANIGQRLVAVQRYLGDEDVFLANYADGLTDLSLTALVECFQRQGRIGGFAGVRPNLSYHAVAVGPDGLVDRITALTATNLRINGGYFVFRREIFDHIQAGEELVHEPFQRLIAKRQLMAYPYDGFFASMDTFKDKQHLDELYAAGKAPWEVWRSGDGRPD